MTDGGPPQRRLGPILLAPGVAPSQVFVFLAVILTAAWTAGFVGLMQPYIISEQLKVPSGQQGVLAGLLGTTQQAAVLIFVGLAGALADRYGRRLALIFALVGFAICCLLFPLVHVVWALFAVRFMMGFASTGWTAGGATKMMDLPDNGSRGKFISFMLIVQAGLGAIFISQFGSKLPGWFRDGGLDPALATQFAFAVIAGVALTGAMIAWFFLQKDGAKRESGTKAQGTFSEVVANFGAVLAHARQNPRFAVTLMVGFVIRTDGAIMATFLGLWVMNAARAQGADPLEITATIGLLTAITSVAGFVTPPIFGFLADRFDRLTMLIIALGLTGLAFCATGFVDDVTGPLMIAVIVAIGLAEGAQTISAQSLFAEQAPAHLRGAAMGLFALLGTSSVLIINFVGGLLFDRVGYTAPFVMEGLLNLAFCATALILVGRQKRRDAAQAAP